MGEPVSGGPDHPDAGGAIGAGRGGVGDATGADSGAHGLVGVADAGAFLTRLLRFDPDAVVRLRPAGPGRVELWGRLPWGVLVGRRVAGTTRDDATVPAASLRSELERGGATLPGRRDGDWRWPLPGGGGRTVETVPAAEVRRVATAAAATLRTAAVEGVMGRAVGQRVLRDALLDHVAIVVTPPETVGPVDAAEPPTGGPAGPADVVGAGGAVVGAGDPLVGTGRPGRPVEVSQRLVQAVSRMGFLGPESASDAGVHVRVVGRWTGLLAPYGSAWWLAPGPLAITPGKRRPNG